MPTYGYFCESCGHKFEKLQKMSDNPLTTCPQCGKKIKRLIGKGLGVIFSNKDGFSGKGETCCGRPEKCARPPCSGDGVCKR